MTSTRSIRPRKTRRRGNPRRQTLAAAAVGALLLIALSYAAVTAGNGLPLKGYYYLRADFRDASELDPYSDVRIGGRLVGQVLGTSFAHGTAIVTLQLRPSAGPLRSGTTARIRLKGLIGAKYVDISPGTRGSKLTSGSTLPASHTSTAVGVFDVLATLDARRRRDLQEVLGGLGQGFYHHGAALNQALAESPAMVTNVGDFAQAVNDRPGAAQRFFPGAEALTAAFDPVRQDLAFGWQPQADALQPFSDQRRSIQATLTLAPDALRGVRLGLAQTDPLLEQTAGLSRELTRFTAAAPSALQAATAMLEQAPPALAKVHPLMQALAAATPPTLQLLTRTWPLAAPTARALGNEIPPLSSLGRYSCDVAGWARDWSELFALGSPPQTPSGPTGLARSSLAANNTASDANNGGLHGRYYEPPCTGINDKAP